jgi:hypothetical protein
MRSPRDPASPPDALTDVLGALGVLVREALRAELAQLRAEIQQLQHLRDDVPPWVGVKRAAELSSLSTGTIRRMIKAGSVVAKKRGSRVMVSTASLLPADATTVAELAAKARR